ncbi:unnamed protein product [Symbiodinium natans]|uniref:Uncharacterized protein n=1 Tax=Symbiodinium natans TaxID=878477 RepID=A0A812S4A0_9DINO|nr:unnamed protein product [Symbiodinium natans]
MASSSDAVAGYVEGEAPIPEPVVSSEGETDGSDSEGETTEEEEPTTPNEQEKQKKDDRDDPDDDEADILAECTNMVPENPQDFFYDSEVITMLESGEDARATIKERYEWYAKMMVAMKKADQKLQVLKKKRARDAKKAKDKEEKAKLVKEEKEQTFKVSLVLPDATVVQFELSKGMTTGEFRLLVGTKLMGMSKKATKKMSLYLDTINVTEVPRRTIAYYKDLCEGSRITVKFSLAGGGKRAAGSAGAKTKAMSIKECLEEINNNIHRISFAGSASPVVEQVKNIAKEAVGHIKSKTPNLAEMLMNSLNKEALVRINTEVVASSAKPFERCRLMSEISYESIHAKLEEMEYQHNKAKEMLTHTIYLFVCSEFADANTNISWASLSEKLLMTIAKKEDVQMKPSK